MIKYPIGKVYCKNSQPLEAKMPAGRYNWTAPEIFEILPSILNEGDNLQKKKQKKTEKLVLDASQNLNSFSSSWDILKILLKSKYGFGSPIKVQVLKNTRKSAMAHTAVAGCFPKPIMYKHILKSG